MKQEVLEISQVNQVLSINIDNKWEITDFIAIFKSLEYLYNYYYFFDQHEENKSRERGVKYSREEHKAAKSVLELFIGNFNYLDYDPLNPFKSETTRLSLYTDKKLSLKKIQYASPGAIDFLGAGKIFETLKDILFNYLPNKKQKAEIEVLLLQKKEMEIKMLKELNFDDAQIKAIVFKKEMALDQLKTLTEDKKITEVKVI